MPNEVPKYLQIYNDLRASVFSGEYPSGAELPSESRLCRQYNVSRETVRKALRDLEKEGLIYAVPKVGYFVGRPNHTDLKLTFDDELIQGRTQCFGVHGMPASGPVADALGIPEGQFVIQITNCTFDEAFTPMGWEEKYLLYRRSYPTVESEMRYAVFPDATLSKLAGFTLYTSVRISAVKAAGEVSGRLLCRDGDPLLLIERNYVQQDNSRIAYSRLYIRQPFGSLSGTTGSIL